MLFRSQQEKPDDFVIATGEQYSVRDFCNIAFQEVGITLKWEGKGIEEKGIDASTGNVIIEVSPAFFRPTDVVNLLGDPTKARTLLGWNPRKTSFEELVRLMVRHDMEYIKEAK